MTQPRNAGRNSLAQGGSPGWYTKSMRAPEGRHKLSPNIFRIEFHAMLFEKGQIFLFEADFSVMRFLILDVFGHRSQIRSTHAECAVSLLPREPLPLFVHPF